MEALLQGLHCIEALLQDLHCMEALLQDLQNSLCNVIPLHKNLCMYAKTIYVQCPTSGPARSVQLTRARCCNLVALRALSLTIPQDLLVGP